MANNLLRNSVSIVTENIANINYQNSKLKIETWPKRKCDIKKTWNIKMPWDKDS